MCIVLLNELGECMDGVPMCGDQTTHDGHRPFDLVPVLEPSSAFQVFTTEAGFAGEGHAEPVFRFVGHVFGAPTVRIASYQTQSPEPSLST